MEENDRITMSSTKLALMFSDELDIPTRFKQKEDKEKKNTVNLNTLVEKRFQENVKMWKNFINILLSKIDNKQAWRFINIAPIIEPDCQTVTKNNDFCDFTDYFVLRRDKENCSDEEIGCLAMLHTAFQRNIEKMIEKNTHNI